ncbi:MAG: hypothetical protein E7271_04120 [Lachnospiraceae bacterium]|nr:hypothetical protein [Lachnospiraceae bacterium]
MLSKKDKANPLLMESRKLLLNQVDVGNDGRLIAVDEIRTFKYGAAEGEHKVRISGITTRDFYYRTKYNGNKAVFQASESMKDIGRRANLQCMDNAAACVVKSLIFYPVVLVLYENSDGRIQLSAFTAKAFLALFAINSALKKFDRELPDAMVRKVSVHSVHDVNMAIIHGLRSLVKKDAEDDGQEYVDIKKLFKSGRKKQKDTDNYSDIQKESHQERKERRKAERLEKKREAARRKYEKLMGIDVDETSNEEGYTEEGYAEEGYAYEEYSDEESDDILLEFTGLTVDELDNLMETDSGNYEG